MPLREIAMDNERGEIMVYQSEDGLTRVDVKFDGDTVWLTQQQMADLFQSSRSNVVEHIHNIYAEGELEESSTCRKFRQVRTEGSRQITRELPYYNLDMIISLGYRVKSTVATRFRQWATARLKEYMIKGFALDDERLNYLNEDELRVLNNLVSGYFDFAEISAIEHRPMYMADYIRQLDSILSSGGRELLKGPGEVSHEAALEKAHAEYRKYQQKTLSPVEEAYLQSLKDTAKKVGGKKDSLT